MIMTFLPFDIVKAQLGAPLSTRFGIPVVFAGYNPQAADYAQVIGWVQGHADSWNVNGKWSNEETEHDIFVIIQ